MYFARKTRERAPQSDNDHDGRNGKVDKKNITQCGVTAILLDQMLKYSCSICCVTTVTLFHVPTHTRAPIYSRCRLPVPAVTL